MIASFFSKLGIFCLWVLLIFSSIKIATSDTFFSNDKNTIHLFTWPEQFEYAAIHQFEKETGIKVVIHNFATNEELVAIMKKSGGKGYDLITPSDYTVKILKDKNLLQPIDKSKLSFFDKLDPFLLGRSYDPQNHYSIPFNWEVYGFGVSKDFLENRAHSWDLIFNENAIDYSIAMSDDPIESMKFASFYLYGNDKNLNQNQLTEVKNLLVKQKKWIEAYSAMRADYFLVTKNCKIAITPSPFLLRAMKQNPYIEFVLPKEGTFITIENMVIPASSNKQELVYKFINFMYEPKNLARHTSYFLIFPPRLDIIEDAEVTDAFKKALYETRKDKNKIHTIDFIMPEDKARQIWVEVKSS